MQLLKLELTSCLGDPKTQANRDTIIAGLSSLGRPTQFHQTINLNWQVPINLLPLMDWTSAEPALFW